MLQFDLAQTFYVDSNAVKDSTHAFITSVDLYFYSKPVQSKTKTGINNPGVTVYICETEVDNTPRLSPVHDLWAARVEYSGIETSVTGATATKFTFRNPVPVRTDRMYGFLIKFDGGDADFKMWYNQAGLVKLGTTEQTQVSSGKVDGYMYTITNGQKLTPRTDADLTFNLNVARFSTESTVVTLVNRAYEIMNLDTTVGRFKGGEYAYQDRTAATGTLTVRSTNTNITGSGTSLSTNLVVGDKIVITDGTAGNTDVRTVTAISNATSMTVDVAPTFTNTSAQYIKTVIGKVYSFDNKADHIVLQDVNTNNSIYLTTSTTLKGVDSQATANIAAIIDYPVHSVIPNFNVVQPPSTTTQVTVNFANSSHAVSSTTSKQAKLGLRSLINHFPAVIASRTAEVRESTTFNSMTANLTFSTTNPYSSPYVRQENLDVYAERYLISSNSTTTNEYNGTGLAASRYVSKLVTLADNQTAEDLRVYVKAHVPTNTGVQVYAKLYNSFDSESFDVKQWTPMTFVNQTVVGVSSKANVYDLKELEFAIPQYQSGTRVAGKFTTQSANAVVTSTSTSVNTSISEGDLVRVYSQIFPTNHFVDIVTAVNSTSFTVSTPVSNSSVTGTGFVVEVIDKTNCAFLDVQASNVATYFNAAGTKQQTYDSFAIKIVPTSEDGVSIPYIDDYRAIAVSA